LQNQCTQSLNIRRKFHIGQLLIQLQDIAVIYTSLFTKQVAKITKQTSTVI